MIQRQDFHVFARGDQHYLFLTQPVALFKVDAETGAALQQLEVGESVAPGAAGERAREAAAFMDDYCRKALPARKLRAPGDISDKVWGLYLFVSQECNLKCAYCYGHEGEYGQRGRMNETTLRQTFDTFLGNREGRHNVTFFGGEPLMNLPIMHKAAALADDFRDEGRGDISFGIVTNGTLYDEEIAGFFRDHIEGATFSLDGPADLNDRQRLSKKSGSVYGQATENIRKLTADKRFGWAFRAIVTREGHDRIEEIYADLERHGPGGIGIVNVDVPEDSPLYLDDGQYRRFLEQVVAINRKGLQSFVDGGQAVAFEYPFYILFHFITRSHALYHCNAGCNLLAVTAEGDIYPCHRFVGQEDFKMGNVADPEVRQSPRYQELRQAFVDATVDQREGCQGCWARYLCGGSCAKYSYARHGDIHPPVERHCLYIKTVIEEILPDIADLVKTPEMRRDLMNNLKSAIAGHHGSLNLDAAHAAA